MKDTAPSRIAQDWNRKSKAKKGVALRHVGRREKLLVTNTKEDSEVKTSTHDVALESSLPVRLLVPLEDG